VEFKKFLIRIDKEVPAGLDVHLICDNASTHKTPAIQRWLAAHPRFHVRFTPTSSSWLNQVERWFGLLTDKQIRRGAHKNVQALEKDIRAWIKTWPKPFVWTKTWSCQAPLVGRVLVQLHSRLRLLLRRLGLQLFPLIPRHRCALSPGIFARAAPGRLRSASSWTITLWSA
jgi:transposase